MRELFEPDLDAIVDAEDAAEFQRGYATLCEQHQRILMILIPRLVALQERGDSAGALKLIAEIRRAVTARERAPH